MPSSSVQKFTDPDEYSPVGQHSNTRLLAIKRPVDFSAKFTAIELPNIRLNYFADTLSRVVRVALLGDRVMFGFLAHPGADGPTVNGVEPKADTLNRLRIVGQESHHQTPNRSSYITLSLPPGVMTGVDELARHLPSGPDTIRHVPPPPALAKLRRLSSAAEGLAEDAPVVIVSSEAARGLEQAFIGTLVGCLNEGTPQEDRAAVRHHAAIMRRFHRITEEHLDEPLYIPEVCKEIGTSLRTLNACCQEHLGTGPKHYLLLRRMHMVRRALRRSTPADTTVTEVSTRYGFWQLGRLAVEYKRLFGESPSDTLARLE